MFKDVCRWLLDELREPASDEVDLSALYRKLSKAFKFASDDHSEQVFKQILGGCQSMWDRLAPCAVSSATRIAAFAEPAARHPGLAANLAGSMSAFLVAI